jgi:hypothetical protein
MATIGGIKRPSDPSAAESTDSLIDEACGELRAADRNGNGVIRAGRFEPELGPDTDPLARAVYDFVDFESYDGPISLWGLPARGDVLEGGGGIGSTFRVKHYTSCESVTTDALSIGATDLRRRLRDGNGNDLATQDLQHIVERGRAAGILPADDSQAQAAISDAVEKLLAYSAKASCEKEVRLHKEVAPLTQQELVDGLKPAAGQAPSLAGIIADTVINKTRAAGEPPQWNAFFAEALKDIDSRAKMLRLPRADETGLVGDTLSHYLLVLGKRAKENELLNRVQSQLAQRMQAHKLNGR